MAMHIPLPHTLHDVRLPATCVRPCKIPQTLMKSIDVECGDIRVTTRERQRDRERDREREREGEREEREREGEREERGRKRGRRERETATQNRKKGQSIKQTNQKFTQTSITTQSRIKINKIITTEHNETWPPTQPQARGTHTHTHTNTHYDYTKNTVNNLQCVTRPHTHNHILNL